VVVSIVDVSGVIVEVPVELLKVVEAAVVAVEHAAGINKKVFFRNFVIEIKNKRSNEFYLLFFQLKLKQSMFEYSCQY
jgi:hypothetical protein